MLVEDVHQCMSTVGSHFLRSIVDLYIEGTINVVGSISEFSAVDAIRSASGHSSCAKFSLFPSLDDDDVASFLVEWGQEIDIQKFASNRHVSATSDGALEFAGTTQGIIVRETEAAYIASQLGDHMGHITECMSDVVSGVFVEDATTAVVAQVDATLAPVLMGDVVARTVEGADKPAVDKAPFVATAFSLLEELSRDGVEQVGWNVVYDAVPNVTSDELLASVHHLVEKNILSFVDPVTVCLHERRIKWAFREKWRDDPDVQRAWKDAKKSYGD